MFREDFDKDNRVVAQNDFEFDGKEYWMSTVDLGVDHQFGEGPPLYFETMIFPRGTFRDMYCNRYTDRETAHERHAQLFKNITDGKYQIVDGYFERI